MLVIWARVLQWFRECKYGVLGTDMSVTMVVAAKQTPWLT